MNPLNPNPRITLSLSRRKPLLAAASLLFAPCVFAQKTAPAASDAAVASAPTPTSGTTITPIVHRPEFEPDVLVLTATVSAGDTVPVQVEGQPKAFDVRVKKVSAAVMEIERFDGVDTVKLVLSRGSGNFFRVDDFEYLLEYPEGNKTNPTGDKATLKIRRVPWNSLVRATTENGIELYTMRFGGSGFSDLRKMVNKAFPKDSLVVSASVQRTLLPAFELRNVRLAEIGRTLEFLSEGQLKVEIVENATSGNIWRIGSANPKVLAESVKMRSVAAPNLFSNADALVEIERDAERIERERLGTLEISGVNFRRAIVHGLSSQKIFVIIGDEEGVAGLESFIRAAEQRLADAAAAKAAAFTADGPKIRAVLAPHVFAEEPRTEKLMTSLSRMQAGLIDLRMEIQKASGMEIVQAPWAKATPRAEQKVFEISGTEAGIAGMESLIRAAEQLAAEEDAKKHAAMNAERAEMEADLKASKDRAKAEKREQ